jgi:hypothetical protein
MIRVCRLWRDVALSPSLWYNIDLASPCIKDKYKTTETVRWLCENRLTRVQELNIGKVTSQFNIFFTPNIESQQGIQNAITSYSVSSAIIILDVVLLFYFIFGRT